LITKNLRTFPGLSRPPKKFFKNPVVSQQFLSITTTSSYEHCKLPQRGPGAETRLQKHFDISKSQKSYLLPTILAILSAINMSIEAKNCHPHHCLANFRTFQDLASRFPRLSRTKVLSQDYPGCGCHIVALAKPLTPK